jgi:hypothetical protein
VLTVDRNANRTGSVEDGHFRQRTCLLGQLPRTVVLLPPFLDKRRFIIWRGPCTGAARRDDGVCTAEQLEAKFR